MFVHRTKKLLARPPCVGSYLIIDLDQVALSSWSALFVKVLKGVSMSVDTGIPTC